MKHEIKNGVLKKIYIYIKVYVKVKNKKISLVIIKKEQ